MILRTFKQRLIKLIEETEDFIIYDNEVDDYFDLPDISKKLNHLVVVGKDHTETFCIAITKV